MFITAVVCIPDQTGYTMLDRACQLIYVLLPLSPYALPVQQRVQGNRVGIQGDGWRPLICQMGCQLLSGAQVIVLQHCPESNQS